MLLNEYTSTEITVFWDTFSEKYSIPLKTNETAQGRLKGIGSDAKCLYNNIKTTVLFLKCPLPFVPSFLCELS